MIRNPWQPAQVNRIELHGANIEKGIVEIVRNLRDDLRFADAASTQMCRGTRTWMSA